MISRKSLFRISIVSSVALATAISGCRLPRVKHRTCHRCNCQQSAANHHSAVVVDSNPYNLPQNADCFEPSPSSGSVITDQSKPEIAPPEPKEIESVPEIEKPIAPEGSTRFPATDKSTKETMAQLQPPVADSPYDFEFIPKPPQVASEAVPSNKTPKPSTQKPVVDESLANERPYYLNNKENKHDETIEQPVSEPYNFQPFPAAPEKAVETKPGAAFDQLAEEIFQNVNLREELNLNPTEAPALPTSFKPPQTNTPSDHHRPSIKDEPIDRDNNPSTSDSEEIFGAIQFDAVLRQGTHSHYAQKIEDQHRVAALESQEQILIRPLPEMRQAVPRIASEPYQFQPMPAYHMPTLRAIPETQKREVEPSVFKIRFTDLPTPPQNESVTIPNPHINNQILKDENSGIIALPVDPQLEIRPLPNAEKAPTNKEFPATSDRRLTNRKLDIENPLR